MNKLGIQLEHHQLRYSFYFPTFLEKGDLVVETGRGEGQIQSAFR